LIFGVSSVLYYTGIRDSPGSIGLPSIEEHAKKSSLDKSENKTTLRRSEKRPLGEEHLGFCFTLRRTFANPRIWVVGIAFMFLDIVRYGFFVWAPTFLFEVQGAEISTAA